MTSLDGSSCAVGQGLALDVFMLANSVIKSSRWRQSPVAARTNDDVDAVAFSLKKAGVATLRLERSTPDDPAAPGVRLATMHRIKRLEFGVVIIAGYKGATKYAALFARDEDAGVSDEAETAGRSILHVAKTRAKRHLFVLVRPGSGI